MALRTNYIHQWCLICTIRVWYNNPYHTRMVIPYAMLHSLNWPSLQLRRRISRLQTFYKATYKLSALSIPSYFLLAQRLTKHYHPLHFIVPCSRTSSYQQSYYPRTIRDWNELTHYIIESNNLQSFPLTRKILIKLLHRICKLFAFHASCKRLF